MKAAVLSESPADEAAVRILVDAILGQKTTPAHLPPLRSRGWPSVLDNLAAIIKHLHYRTDAEALVVVVDTNGSPLQGEPDSEHTSAKDSPRLFRLAEQVQTVQRSLKPVPGKEPLRISLGVAAPSVEAWYQCGIDPTATEAAWMRDLDAGAQAPARIRSLKRAVYGTDIPPLDLETTRATEQAHRLADDLSSLERHFPHGFGALAESVRSWLSC